MRRSIDNFFTANTKVIDRAIFYLSMVTSIGITVNLGSKQSAIFIGYFDIFIVWIFILLAGFLFVKTLITHLNAKNHTRFAELLISFYFLLVIAARSFGLAPGFFSSPNWLYAGIFGIFLIEASKGSLLFDRFYFNPTLLFVVSFLLLILLGTLLLLLPNATIGAPLTTIDALFMSTSAVCITGLSVIDISVRLSDFGQVVLLLLIQLGGLGIMTFTGFFGYFFSGGFSYKTQLMYTEILSENKLASVINNLLKIIFITFLIEAVGAFFIYLAIDGADFASEKRRTFFAVFHSISAFCNAGFSILPDGLHHNSVRFNYTFQLVVAMLFIVGGLGFGIVLNTFHFIKRWVINFYKRLVFKKAFVYKAWVITFNAKLVAWTTFILLVIGTAGIFILEYDRSLSEHTGFWGKLAGAFFMGASPRTAGFNSVDMGLLSFPAIMLIMFLMWIGASPGSTGGGIKTSTFAVGMLNFLSLAKGQDRVEAFGREIGMDSVRRSSAIIFLSLFALAITVFGLSITDQHKNLIDLALESFSAFSTVGLSLGITPELSDAGRIILAISMFVGRVGTLTLLIAFIKKTSFKSYRYPQEKVLF